MAITEKTKILEHKQEWAILQQERGKVIQVSSEETQSTLKALKETIASLTNKLEEKSTMLIDTDESLKTIQFENDEMSIKLEKYENAMKDHQTVLEENETFIEQLNQEVATLNEKLKTYEEESAEHKKKTQKVEEDVVMREEPKDESVKLKENLIKAETKVQKYGEKIERLEKQMHRFYQPEKMTPAGKLKMQAGTRTPDVMMKTPAAASPYLKQTPLKKIANTPNKGSPYSPASKVSHQQTIKKLTKLLEETSKALEKKTALVVTKNNRVTHLESQVNALEKKQGIKELTVEKSGLQQQVVCLETEVSEMRVANQKLEFKLANEEENAGSLNEEIEVLTTKCDELNDQLVQLIMQKEASEKRHETEMRHHCLLLLKANESSEGSSKKIDELGTQVNNAERVIEELRNTLEKVKAEEIKLKTNLVETRSQLTAKTVELKEAQDNIIADKKTIEVRDFSFLYSFTGLD